MGMVRNPRVGVGARARSDSRLPNSLAHPRTIRKPSHRDLGLGAAEDHAAWTCVPRAVHGDRADPGPDAAPAGPRCTRASARRRPCAPPHASAPGPTRARAETYPALTARSASGPQPLLDLPRMRVARIEGQRPLQSAPGRRSRPARPAWRTRSRACQDGPARATAHGQAARAVTASTATIPEGMTSCAVGIVRSPWFRPAAQGVPRRTSLRAPGPATPTSGCGSEARRAWSYLRIATGRRRRRGPHPSDPARARERL